FLTSRVPLFPDALALKTAQDRLGEKHLMAELGIPTAAFAEVSKQADVYSALARTGRPAILKTRRLGYDGKGQALIRGGDDPVSAWRATGEAPAILEAFVNFEREISVILARGRDGARRAFDIGANVHEGGILATTTIPAPIPADLSAAAVAIAE